MFKIAQLKQACFALCCILLIGCSKESSTPQDTADAPQAPTKIRLQLDWYAQPEYGGFFQALAEGYYEAAGLDVEIINGSPGFPFFQAVAKGSAEFGTVRFDMLAQAVQEGLPLTAVGYYMAHSPAAIMVLEDSPIKSFKDLEGKSLMANPVVPYLGWLRQNYAIEFSVVPSKWEVATFMAKQVDAQQCFITSEPYYLAQQGVQVRTMMIGKTGFDPYRIFYVNNTFAQNNPDAVRAFVQASIKGWVSFFTENSDKANSLIAEKNNKLTPEFIAWSKKTMMENKLVFGDVPPPYTDHGKLKPDKLNALMNVLRQLDLIDSDFDVTTAYTLQYTDS